MRFVNDKADHEQAYCSLMTRTHPAEAINEEARSRITKACEDMRVPVSGCYVYRSESEDDVDAFVLASPGGYMMVLSSEAADVDAETMSYFCKQADADAFEHGPETAVDVQKLNQKPEKGA